MPQTHFLLLGMLPRADDLFDLGTNNAPTNASAQFPHSKFYSPILTVNSLMQLMVAERAGNFLRASPVHFVVCPSTWRVLLLLANAFAAPLLDCFKHFLTKNMMGAELEIDQTLLPDMVHLSGKGYLVWQQCVQDVLAYISREAGREKMDEPTEKQRDRPFKLYHTGQEQKRAEEEKTAYHTLKKRGKKSKSKKRG
ncbi:hypothetical protein CYMTET_18390 [Cymbomonas tetramitiformis]|uniref:Uncharacterized protein n=1 Tax=Cymbomonas tetramitiformis TaxID=36881 RepID=A0AAE0G856_9CHLO|nr:hypothetical protein CYMTET_18390 [Cymbomonas tetramitiformis]